MSENPNETFAEYKARVMDPVSPTFCAAKWFNSTLWLGSGTTASCHLPPAHKIPTAEVERDPAALHNTTHKMLMRSQMLRGERPSECEYCWKIEDLGAGHMSDRLFKTRDFSEKEIAEVAKASAFRAINPRTLEIAFDRVCQFACSYCNASFSTKWGADIAKNGNYRDLRTDGGGAYRHDGSWAQPYSDEKNPYLQAFWKWWPTLAEDLREIRVTGGEPLLSRQTWRLIDDLVATPRPRLGLAINSNLGLPTETLDRLVEKTRALENFHIYTSCEAVGPVAEYLRDGLNYERYTAAVERLLREGGLRRLSFMLTVPALSLAGIDAFLDRILDWKKEFADRRVNWMVNILRFPSFMSPLVLPPELRADAIVRLEKFLARAITEPLVQEWEAESVRRLIHYLKDVERPHSRASDARALELDFKAFYTQYDRRRGKDFVATFPQWADWYRAIPYTPVSDSEKSVDGDSSKGWHDANELRRLALRDGVEFSG